MEAYDPVRFAHDQDGITKATNVSTVHYRRDPETLRRRRHNVGSGMAVDDLPVSCKVGR